MGNLDTDNENIRKIEDIIDIQKANGNFIQRQVSFNIPSVSDSSMFINAVKNLDSGLSESANKLNNNKKNTKFRIKRQNSPLADVISWPSDSDITVLRMKLCLTDEELKELGNTVLGDGLHVTDSSSMINLATLMLQSEPSKHSLNPDEYLLPLTSWEMGNHKVKESTVTHQTQEIKSQCNQRMEGGEMDYFSKIYCEPLLTRGADYGERQDGFKSKWARFMRLYFCPCCTCLYNMERLSEDPSVYYNNKTH